MTTYDRVAGALRDRILSGKLQPGQRLPPERDLCRRFSASRITIRRALEILQQELLIHRRQGDGTYVSAAPARKIPILATDFSGSVARHAPELRRRLVTREWRGADPSVAEQLDTFPGDRTLYARRVDSLQGAAVAMDDVYLPAGFAENLIEDDWVEIDFLARWREREGLEFSHVSQVVEAAVADATTAELLGVPAGGPVLKSTEVIRLVGGRPAGLFISAYRHDTFRLTATVRLSARVQEVSA